MSSNSLKTLLFPKDGASLHQTVESIYMNMGKEEYEKSVISAVNNALLNSKTRLMGLELLQSLILYCSHDVLSENVLNWSNYCMVHHVEDPGKEVKLNTLETILDKTKDLESFTKKFSAEYLNITLKACLVYRSNAEKNAGLKCLIQCMKKYPSWFGNHKQKVEAHLIKCLEGSCQVTAETAAIAFVCFLETGPAGVNSTNYVNNFSSNFKKLCATIQLLYNNLFQDFPEINNSANIDGEVFKELTVGYTSENSVEVISNRIINCLIFLKTLITKRFSVEKRIVPKYVFDIICRGLSTHICGSEATISNVNSRSTFLKKIQIHLFNVFGAMIQGYQTSLMPFGALVENSLLNSLQRTSKCDCFVFDKTYKTCIYKTFVKWLKVNKVMSDSHFQQKLIPLILEDITPVRKTTVLNVDKSGKKKLKLNDSTNNRKALISDIVAESNCMSALETLKCLLSTSLTVDRTILKDLVIFVIKTLDDIQVGRTAPPYDNVACEIKLYEVFISFFNIEDFKLLLPTMHPLINVLNRGLKSRNQKVSRVSSEGLEMLQKICHPVCSSLDVWDFRFLGQDRHFNYDLLDKRDEFIEDTDKKQDKEIKIISNIVINKPNDNKQKEDNFEDVVEIEEEMESTVNDSPELVVDEQMFEKNETCLESNVVGDNESGKSPEIDHKVPEADDVAVEQKSEGNVKESDVDNGVEDMFDSFIDEVQE